jgi:hypothetical protein
MPHCACSVCLSSAHAPAAEGGCAEGSGTAVELSVTGPAVVSARGRACSVAASGTAGVEVVAVVVMLLVLLVLVGATSEWDEGGSVRSAFAIDEPPHWLLMLDHVGRSGCGQTTGIEGSTGYTASHSPPQFGGVTEEPQGTTSTPPLRSSAMGGTTTSRPPA